MPADGSSRTKPWYGIDAPGVVRLNILLALVFAAVAAQILPAPSWLRIGAAVLSLILLSLAAVMLWASLVGKKRVRDRLVAAIALAGNERVLDAGCGSGLALIGCAKRLSTGKAIGVDLWAAKDLSGNDAASTMANAAAEGVADRIEVETGDLTQLRFADGSFDAIVSMTVLHNLPSHEARMRAIDEMVRVLKPGGQIALFDILHTSRYRAALETSGLFVRELARHRLWLMPGRSLLAIKPK